MYSKAQFVGDFVKAYGYLGPGDFHRGQLTEAASRCIDDCYRVYQNSATNPLKSLVIGRIVKKDGAGKRLNLDQIGHGLDDIERANFRTTNAGSDGSVLDASNWSIPMNDAWIMAGIHARLDFYVASPRTESNILDPAFGATVTGRERLELTIFGYTLHPNTRLGEVYVGADQGRALGATFVAYEKAFGEAKAQGGFRSLVAKGAN
jgi:hypothetical protein